jgi:ABC-2 type transport system permease protein
MTATLADISAADAPADTDRPVPVARAYRFELTKQFSSWRVRLLLLACLVGPGLLVFGISLQATLPSDTLFGREMHATGWAGPLVTLGVAGTWALPLVASLVAGDVFAAEDRLGTWRHLVVAVRSHRRIFAAKSLASVTVVLLLVGSLALSAVIGGLIAEGSKPLIGLDDHILSPGDAAVNVLLAWLCALAPTLALVGIGLLGSVAFGRSPLGLVLPVIVALGMQLAQILPLPVAVRFALPGWAFISWYGLFSDPQQLSPLLIGVAVSLAWAVAATALAYLLFLRRDFTNLTNDGVGRRALTVGVLPLVGLLAVTIGILAASTGATGSGIDQDKLQQSLATAYAHLYRLQEQELHRPPVTEAQLQVTSACTKGDGLSEPEGPGNDWRCTVSWHIPGVAVTGQAIYQLDVNANGRYIADGDGPKEVNGYFLVRTPDGDEPNPLWQFDGNVDLLPSR